MREHLTEIEKRVDSIVDKKVGQSLTELFIHEHADELILEPSGIKMGAAICFRTGGLCTPNCVAYDKVKKCCTLMTQE